MDVIQILMLVKIVIGVWSVIFLIACTKAIKNVVNLIPKAVFEKTHNAYSVTIQIPHKVINFITRRIIRRK